MNNYRRVRSVVGRALLAGTVLSIAGPVFAADVTFERLLAPEDANWLTNNRTYDSHRYSPLDEITRDNVSDLKVAFAVPLTPRITPGFLGGGLQSTPLVDDGIMYVTDAVAALYRIDVSSGDHGYINWIMDPETDPEIDGLQNNRGAALWGDGLFTMTRDGYLTFTNGATGEVVWDVGTELDPEGDDYFTMAPLALEDRVIIGPAGDAPMRGWIEGRSAVDGSELWHFWIIPGPGEPGGETWPADTDAYLSGASALWTTGSWDPESHLVYWGTANPTPFGDPALRPGDNLYSSSLIAINTDTGQLEWYFQYTPNEQWDYDEIGSHQLIQNAEGRNVVQHFGRNGFTYTLDAATGEFINGVQYVNELNWTAGLDPKSGMPVEYDPALAAGGIQAYSIGALNGEGEALLVCPNVQGGVNFQPTTYSERTGLHYGAAMEACSGDEASERATGSIVAIDANGDVVQKADIPFVPYGGNLSTGGGLVFSAMVNGDFFAMDDETLDVLWSINLGSTIEAPPMTYEVDGKQYVVIPVGTSTLGDNYGGRGDDPNVASLANQQRTWTIYFFAL